MNTAITDAAISAILQAAVFGGVPLLGYVIYHRARHGRPVRESVRRAGLQLGERRYLLYSLLFALLGVVILILWSPPLEPLTRQGSAQRQFVGLGFTMTAITMAFLNGVVQTAFSEELLFRGLIAGSLSRRLPLLWANVTQALIFLLPHFAIPWRSVMNLLMRKGILVAVLHVAIVGSLGAKLLVDRAVRPRVWARAAPVDPNLPIRGRYVRLRLEAAIGYGLDLPVPAPMVPGEGRTWTPPDREIALAVVDKRLTAVPASEKRGLQARATVRDGERVAVLNRPLAYFIPEHVPDPSFRKLGEELWVEVTIPRRGPPRPIRLGVKKDGVLTPLEFD